MATDSATSNMTIAAMDAEPRAFERHFPFTSLSREIRIEIYELTMISDSPLRQTNDRARLPAQTFNITAQSLLLANREIYVDASIVLYRENNFVFFLVPPRLDGPEDRSLRMATRDQAFKFGFGDAPLRFMTKIEWTVSEHLFWGYGSVRLLEAACSDAKKLVAALMGRKDVQKLHIKFLDIDYYDFYEDRGYWLVEPVLDIISVLRDIKRVKIWLVPGISEEHAGYVRPELRERARAVEELMKKSSDPDADDQVPE